MSKKRLEANEINDEMVNLPETDAQRLPSDFPEILDSNRANSELLKHKSEDTFDTWSAAIRAGSLKRAAVKSEGKS